MPNIEQLEDIEAPEENELGHLLATVNPAAAAAIDNPPVSPDVGTWVVFKGRDGFSRMHRTEFPALVLGTDPTDGSLTLMVVMEPEDMLMETRVPFCSHNQPHFCWRYRKAGPGDDQSAELAARITAIEDHLKGDDALVEDVEQLRTRVATVESVLASDEIEQIEKGMWGGHPIEVRAISLYDQLVMLTNRVEAMAQSHDDLANAVLPDGEVKTSRTPRKGK